MGRAAKPKKQPKKPAEPKAGLADLREQLKQALLDAETRLHVAQIGMLEEARRQVDYWRARQNLHAHDGRTSTNKVVVNNAYRHVEACSKQGELWARRAQELERLRQLEHLAEIEKLIHAQLKGASRLQAIRTN